ncbi:hypothetical protein AB1Y20_007153 [Prymnesium parvum]|uniref:Uncharacterized protein n=1 Tax=Prymnesium parvum TaxID=97485 RepID=A0AB34IWN0_PRYPA
MLVGSRRHRPQRLASVLAARPGGGGFAPLAAPARGGRAGGGELPQHLQRVAIGARLHHDCKAADERRLLAPNQPIPNTVAYLPTMRMLAAAAEDAAAGPRVSTAG